MNNNIRQGSETTSVKIDLDKCTDRMTDSFYKFGCRLAYRWKRDSQVILSENVLVEFGGFPESGGSKQYPKLAPLPGTILIITDVLKSAVIAAIKENPEAYSFCSGNNEKILLLENEKKELIKRLEIITNELDLLYSENKD